MQQIVTTGVVLTRTNYGEADRILTIISPDHGKLKLIAKGVRKIKSKLAGGIELFSVSNITYIPGKREIGTLVSTRLVSHYSHVVGNLDRTTIGYEFLKLINKTTQDQCDAEFYHLLVVGLSNLNDLHEAPNLVEAWFIVRLLKALGHEPNLKTDTAGVPLQESGRYNFDHDAMCFTPATGGKYNDHHIKLLRLLLSQTPDKLHVINQVDKVALSLKPLLKSMLTEFVTV